MHILILTTAYGPSRTHAPLIESLSEAMAADGHHVRVAGVDWDAIPNSAAQHYFEPNGVEVVLTAPWQVRNMGKVIGLLSKWAFSSRAALPLVKRVFGNVEYDLMIVMTPAVTLRSLILWGQARSRRSLAYITDFFPIQHASAGLLPIAWLKDVAQRAETRLLRRFDTLATMSPLGVDFLRTRFDLLPGQPIETLYLWTDASHWIARPRADVRREHGLSLDERIVVFGGQITHGRGVEDILAAASLAAQERLDIRFLFIGDGPLRHLIDQYISSGGENVSQRTALPHAEYLDVIASCDVGLVAVLATNDSPAFPSKTIDYLKAGLPVVASVGRSSDYGTFLTERGFGVAVEPGDPDSILAAVKAATGDRANTMREAGRTALLNIFSARFAAGQIIEMSRADNAIKRDS